MAYTTESGALRVAVEFHVHEYTFETDRYSVYHQTSVERDDPELEIALFLSEVADTRPVTTNDATISEHR